MYCKNCGSLMDDDSRFCKICGTAADESTAPCEDPELRHKSREPHGRPVGPPVFGILSLVCVIVIWMIYFYSFRVVSDLKSNLQDYYAQLDDQTLVGQFGGQLVDFFTGGSHSKKMEDVKQMEADLTNGRNIMGAGLFFITAAALLCFFGVMRNIKRPPAGRALFSLSYILVILGSALTLAASIMLYIITELLLMGIALAVISIIFAVIETQRIRMLKRRHFHEQRA